MKTLLILSLSLLINTGCAKDFSDYYPYDPPVEKNDGLRVGTLPEVQIDSQMILKAVGRIEQGKYGEIHSMLIYKDDRLVFEDYYEGHQYQWDAPGHYGNYVSWNGDMQHCIHSDSKSFVSLCIGIAVDKGFINSVNQSIFDYLPDHQHLKTAGKENITIEHLLTMTSGLEWEEWKISLGSIKNDQIAIYFYEDGPVNYALGKPLVQKPGTSFNYSGGDIQILVEILRNATGMSLDEFSGKYIFEPLGITSGDWWLKFPSGEVHGAGGLKMTPRDMVKAGIMMLNKGEYNGIQVISEEWVEKCTSQYENNTGIKVPGEDIGKVGYGYTWWTKNFNYKGKKLSWCFALGWGGQKIVIMPELDMVLVFTGANYESKVHDFEITERFILPAIYD